jgi:hypothetical protein
MTWLLGLLHLAHPLVLDALRNLGTEERSFRGLYCNMHGGRDYIIVQSCNNHLVALRTLVNQSSKWILPSF